MATKSRRARGPLTLAALIGLAGVSDVTAQLSLPPGFTTDVVLDELDDPVQLVFANDGRAFVAEQGGIVRVTTESGALQALPFIDLRDEVGHTFDRGLLSVSLDPEFASNGFIYLLYTVDPIAGPPDEPGDVPSFGRLTRFTATEDADGNMVSRAGSRHVLIGESDADGFPVCYRSHTIGTLRFGPDGALFVGAGDGARFGAEPDGGGLDPDCIVAGTDADVGAFRSQYLGSLAGKILRIDPATGLGLPDNPFFTGDPRAPQSRVWVSGLRNPYRFTVIDGTDGAGALLIGDVGWMEFEELNVARGGENFGWPCFEGIEPTDEYPELTPPVGCCHLIESDENPGPLTDPVVSLHHHFGVQSVPPIGRGRAILPGAQYTGTTYPAAYRGAFFTADFVHGWIRVLRLDAEHELASYEAFIESSGEFPVDLVAHPITGDLHCVSIVHGTVRRIVYLSADVTGDGIVGPADLSQVLSAWGVCADPCAADLDGDGVVDSYDLILVLEQWD